MLNLFKPKAKNNQSFEAKLLRYLLVAALVPSTLLIFTLWYFQVSFYLSALTLMLVACVVTVCAFSFHQKSNYQLRSLTNLLIGLNEGDYSMRGIHLQNDGALAELVAQMNTLTDTLTKQRFIAHESQLLVSKIIQHIDVSIIAIDHQQHIALLNPAAEKLLATTQEEAVGKALNHFHAQELLAVTKQNLAPLSFLPQQGNYQVIRDQYREQGQQHDLFFITHVQGLLREHERQAWQNLIRVLSHEINNSLSPIASLANTLKSQANKHQLDDIYADNLDIISQRAERLRSFIDSYRQVSFLPKPQLKLTNITQLISDIKPLFPNREIQITSDLSKELLIDKGQIEQVMINLLKNADESMTLKVSNEKSTEQSDINESQGIDVKILKQGNNVMIKITDQGIGLKNTENLFTPFYSTKKQGSGIGLLLSRQIIEAHDGYLSIFNREDVKQGANQSGKQEENQQGCVVEILLPNNK